MSGQTYGFWESLSISNSSLPYGFTPSQPQSFMYERAANSSGIAPYTPPPSMVTEIKPYKPYEFPTGPSSTSYVNAGVNPGF